MPQVLLVLLIPVASCTTGINATAGGNLQPVSMRVVANSIGINDTGGKFATGVK
jgi:hypothetical protein